MLGLALAIALVVQAGALAVIAYAVDPAADGMLFFAAWGVAAAAALAALLVLRRADFGSRAILLAAVLLRLAVLPAEPSLSDDVWRYLHDGRAQLAGFSPFAFAPADERTEPFRGVEHPGINHPHLVTIYPPAAQLAFAAAAVLGSTLLSWKAVLLATELALLGLIASLLRGRGRDRRLLALYAWHPLAVLEVAANAHVEPVALAPLVAALLFATRGRPSAAGAMIALSAAAKYWAAPLLPFVARASPARTLLAALATLIVLYAPYMAAGPSPLGSLGAFTDSWESNAGAFRLLLAATGTRNLALATAATLLAVLLVMLWRRAGSAEDAAFGLVFATLLLSPVVHPWYLVWLAALLPLARCRPAVLAAAGWWTLSAPAAYTALPGWAATGEWIVPPAALVLQLGPVAALLAAGPLAGAGARLRARVAAAAA